MCMPHGSKPLGGSDRRERKVPKKHIPFDEKRMKGDPDFIDERTNPYVAKEEGGLSGLFKSLFS